MASKQRRQRRGQAPAKGRRGRKTVSMVFSRTNYLLLLVGLAVITIGYVIMRLENEVDGFISLYIAPVLILGGYLEIIYAIIYRPKSERESGADQS